MRYIDYYKSLNIVLSIFWYTGRPSVTFIILYSPWIAGAVGIVTIIVFGHSDSDPFHSQTFLQPLSHSFVSSQVTPSPEKPFEQVSSIILNKK